VEERISRALGRGKRPPEDPCSRPRSMMLCSGLLEDVDLERKVVVESRPGPIAEVAAENGAAVKCRAAASRRDETYRLNV